MLKKLKLNRESVALLSGGEPLKRAQGAGIHEWSECGRQETTCNDAVIQKN